jgi:hypothetical protein
VAAHTTAEEAAHTDTPPDIAADTPRDTEADTPPNNIEANTPPPDNADNDDAAHVDTVSGPPSGMDPSVTLIPPQHQTY